MPRVIWASSYSRIGTCYYHCSLDELMRAIRGSSDDADVKRQTIRLLRDHGFDAFDMDKLPGSRLLGDEMYLCMTDGHPIKVNGEWHDPEDVLFMCELDDIKDRIRKGPSRLIKQRLTMREMKDKYIPEELR